MHHHLILVYLLSSFTIKGTHSFHSPSHRLKEQLAANTKKCCPPLSMSGEASYSCPNETTKTIYSIQGSGWGSPQWNWGYAQGTGHDCAAICRRKWGGNAADNGKSDRRQLVQSLLDPVTFKGSHQSESEVPFEEIKLILGLAWQNGRWDGSDGGPNGYSHVLQIMANAHRYEQSDEVISALNFIEDVSARFDTIHRNAEELKRMKAIANDVRGGHAGRVEEVFMARRTVAGLVLDAMNFVENGL